MRNFIHQLSVMLVAAFLFLTNANAQKIGPLWGMTTGGGDSTTGVLFKYNVFSAKDSIVRQFPLADNLSVPGYSRFIQAMDGNYYATMINGGTYNKGCIIECTPTGSVKIMASFNGSNGAFPYSGVIQGADGNLYGTASEGGSAVFGTIFKCTLGGTITTVISFDSLNGENPFGSLIQFHGYLYGMTNSGGLGKSGTVFKCSTAGVLTKLIDFSNKETPYGGLIVVNDSLYGMTNGGGSAGYGTIFKCDTLGKTLITMVDFLNKETPYGDLIFANDGMLYGMTNGGGTNANGSLFKCTTSGSIATLVSFAIGSPYGSLIQGADSNFYGMTNDGGTYNSGTIFQCTTTGTLSTLVNLTSANSYPQGSLLQAANGELYGMANGIIKDGTVFKCTTKGVFTTLFYIGSTDIGNTPYGSLMQASDGNFYGMTQYGGLYGGGTLFSVSANAAINDIINFSDTNGAYPLGSLVQGNDSMLYGMTSAGGQANLGTLFKFNIKTGILTRMYSFSGSDGNTPYGNITVGKDSNLYGMTESGGKFSGGEIFKCTQKGILTVLHSFPGAENPTGSLVQATDGNLYGLASDSGSGYLFCCSITGIFTKLNMFLNKEHPAGSLIQGVDSALYGMAFGGGTSDSGYIFKYTLAGKFTDVYDLTRATGTNPYGSLLQATDSAFYGMTSSGGKNDMGTVFKFTKAGTIDTLFSFSGHNGENPMYNNFAETMSIGIPVVAFPCTGQTLSASVNGGGPGVYKYKWSNGSTSSSISGIIAAGTYTVKVSNAKGLTLTQSITLPSYRILTAQVTKSDLKCMGSNDGSATATAVNGKPPYTYSWNTSPVQTTATISNLKPNAYIVTITDANSCMATQTVTISNPAKVDVVTNSIINASCNGCSDGSAVVNITGGNKNVIVWSDSIGSGYAVLGIHTADSINNITAGTYVCSVTDSCGDSKTDTVRVKQPAPLGIQVLSTSDGITIYPMPTNGHFIMAMAGDGYLRINIYDEAGSKIYSRELSDLHSNGSMTIDLSAYANGIYFAQLITFYGTVNKKIIIQK